MGPLAGTRFALGPDGAARWADRLLRSLGAATTTDGAPAPPHDPAADWARSGAMDLTGAHDGPPLTVTAPVATCARGAATAIAHLSARLGARVDLDGGALLGERAALAGLRRNGRTAPGGHACLLRAADGWFALGLPRADDRALARAWMEDPNLPEEPAAAVWSAVEQAVASKPVAALVARARLLGLPAAPVPAGRADSSAQAAPWRFDAGATRAPVDRPVVVDLSALWAGPLVAHVLGLAGASVLKVEDPNRPDGARSGSPDLFDLLHAGHEQVALDLRATGGRAELGRLLERADVVVESSRPRALAQLGLSPAAVRRTNPGVVWVSITGYGYRGRGRDWAALGDDAAVAGGLVATLPDGTPAFCADALADPLTGLHAAVGALACLAGGRGGHIDTALSGVAACVAAAGPVSASPARPEAGGWVVDTREGTVAVARPRARRATRAA
jgi:crotonobetainyl-CoA:carnitine CoA-transferase CaiB-like acyl-CoA transferase